VHGIFNENSNKELKKNIQTEIFRGAGQEFVMKENASRFVEVVRTKQHQKNLDLTWLPIYFSHSSFFLHEYTEINPVMGFPVFFPGYSVDQIHPPGFLHFS
jgi:hypothetical protein